MLLLIFYSYLAQTTKAEGFLLKEIVEVSYPGGETTRYQNHTWVGQNRVRSDRLDMNTTIIYDLDLHIVYLIDHNDETYQISRASISKQDSRLSLTGLAPIRDGTLERRSPFAESTGNRRKIGSYICDEYKLTYPEEYGIETTIWTTYHRFMTKSYVRKVWYSAIGTTPPGDVKHVLNSILREVRGIPIQIETTISLEGHQITTKSTITQIEPFSEDELTLMAIPSGYHIRRQP